MKQFLKFTLASILGVFISLFIFFIGLFVVFTIIVTSLQVSKKDTIPANSVLEIKLNYDIPERTHFLPFNGFPFMSFEIGRQVGLNDILANIKKAAKDKNIKGIYLNLNSFIAGGLPTIEAIRRELIEFKKSKKFIIAYGDYVTQSGYYLATAADKIFVTPEGDVDFKGFSLELMFFKNTLEKLDIDPQIFRHGDYKSAIEPFTNEEMSKENREQLSSLLKSTYNHFLKEIEQRRNIPSLKLNAIADSLLVRTPEDAIEYGLIDSVLYFDEVRDYMQKEAGKPDRELTKVTLEDYINIKVDNTVGSGDRIAIIYAVGDIINVEGESNTIGIKNITDAIKQARDNNRVKAIVMRVNSPGGDPLISDIIRHEVEITKKIKPFVVSMGEMAASGGYYIACAADSIFAEPNTITGSIGVFGIIPNFKNFFNNKLGITFDVVKTGKFSDLYSLTRPLTQQEKGIIQQEIDRIYKTFVSKVADGRNMTFEQVDEIAKGRIWTGLQAKENGLVDNIGGIETAIKAAAKMAGIKQYKIVEYPSQKNFLRTVLEDFFADTEGTYMSWKLGENYKYFQMLERTKKLIGIQARPLFEININ